MSLAADGQAGNPALDIVSYDLTLDFTHGGERFWSRSEVRFRCRQPGATAFADLMAAGIQRARLNGADLDPAVGYRGGRLALPQLAEENNLTVTAELAYTSAAEGLHYVSVPEDGSATVYSKASGGGARRIFCCFDDHDLRAAFTVSLRAPAGWSCMANAPMASRPPQGDPGIWRFAPTAPIPPWLFGLCAGAYCGPGLVCQRCDGSPLPVTVQTARPAAASLDPGPMLDLCQQTLRYYEHTFARPYPYPKCDLVFVPALPALAYSRPGLIVIDDQVLNDQQPARYLATVIAHELAHAWIGCLVTITPREDTWLAEALTTYISRIALAGILPGAGPQAEPAAPPDHGYAADAATVRELEGLIGRKAVIDGMAALVRRHAHGSATKNDLVRYWSAAVRRDLANWASETLIPAETEKNEPPTG